MKFSRSLSLAIYLMCCCAIFGLTNHYVSTSSAADPCQQDFAETVKRLSKKSEPSRMKLLKSIGAPLQSSNSSFQWDRFRVMTYPQENVLLTLTWDSPRVGNLVLYSSDGGIISRVDLPRIENVRQLDLDADGVCELLIESYGAGTGIEIRQFHIFRVTAHHGIQEVWSDVAESTEGIDSQKICRIASTLSFRFGGANSATQLLYIKRTEIQEKNGDKRSSRKNNIYDYGQLKDKLESIEQNN